jgi:hypothetical protein
VSGHKQAPRYSDILKGDEFRAEARRLIESPAKEWTTALSLPCPSRWDWPMRWRAFRLAVKATKAALLLTLARYDKYEIGWPRADLTRDDNGNIVVHVCTWGDPLLLLDKDIPTLEDIDKEPRP